MYTVCEENRCTGCMACVDVCAKGAIRIVDDMSAYNAVIDPEKCVGCNACYHVCQNKREVVLQKPIAWHQGWAIDAEVRSAGSSGGVATAIAIGFIAAGGKVCSCYFEQGEFRFKLVDRKEDLSCFSGSKYVKSNPQGIYKQIKDELKRGEKILFIGLPCQVAALKLYVGAILEKSLYTIDLICHGTPSPKVLDLFLEQYGKSLLDLTHPRFRNKARMQLFDGETGIVEKGVCDHYTIAFLNGLTYTDNCYACPYAQLERVSDITLGDSWGSALDDESCKKGISLALVQTEKGKKLLEQANLYLQEVDIGRAVAHNQQLESPSQKPQDRTHFFTHLANGKRFNSLVKKSFPRQCFKQGVKKVLIKLRLYH